MSKFDDVKGRAKEAAGDLTDDEDLQREGRLDQAGAKVKEKVDAAKEWVSDKAEEVKDRR